LLNSASVSVTRVAIAITVRHHLAVVINKTYMI
jgi:hypothetical protein